MVSTVSESLANASSNQTNDIRLSTTTAGPLGAGSRYDATVQSSAFVSSSASSGAHAVAVASDASERSVSFEWPKWASDARALWAIAVGGAAIVGAIAAVIAL